MVMAATLLAGLGGSACGAADMGRFDGKWDVTLACPKGPDGVQPFTWEFRAEVKDSVLHGEHGTAGQPAWMSLEGSIGDDGVADLLAKKLTGLDDYNLSHAGRGVPWQHPVTARFEAAHGKGHWLGPRTCDFTFERVKP
jgi:hypothetical protein